MPHTTLETADDSGMSSGVNDGLALVVAWCAHDPSRAGEILPVPREGAITFGRGASDGDARATLVRQRPGGNVVAAALDDPYLSRAQLRISAHEDGVVVENLGKRALLVDGRATTRALVEPGQTIEIKQQLLLMCARRPARWPAARFLPATPAFPFGDRDAHGIVGESPQAWALRDEIAFLGARSDHVLLIGESGTGKELVANAIHATSARAGRTLVSRSAATFPPGLIDSELFGNVAGYPNAGMPERPGLIGAAHGSTLFLDEIGELPSELQAHLLRVLDRGGDYQRLGEAKKRQADVRVVAATNRAAHELKADLAARLSLRALVPGLNARRADVPLLVRHLLRAAVKRDAMLSGRFFDDAGEPRVSLALAHALLAHAYTTHVRELESLLWVAVRESEAGTLELTDGVRAMVEAPSTQAAESRATPTPEITREALAAAIDRHAGVREKIWRDLGLANRYVLKRLLKKHGLVASE